MLTIEETVSASELDPDAIQLLKTWLTSADVGYNLGGAPTVTFFALSYEQLQKAGLTLPQSYQMLAELLELKAQAGEWGDAPLVSAVRPFCKWQRVRYRLSVHGSCSNSLGATGVSGVPATRELGQWHAVRPLVL